MPTTVAHEIKISSYHVTSMWKENKNCENDTIEISHDSVNYLSEVPITKFEVFEASSSLKLNKAPGPDNLHAQVLMHCAESLTKPLFLLFTQSLNTSVLPSDWRRVHITPIFKKGSKVNPDNYRPVSLTSQVIKVLETLVRSKIMKFLDENEIITNCQHGFIKKKLFYQSFDNP